MLPEEHEEIKKLVSEAEAMTILYENILKTIIRPELSDKEESLPTYFFKAISSPLQTYKQACILKNVLKSMPDAEPDFKQKRLEQLVPHQLCVFWVSTSETCLKKALSFDKNKDGKWQNNLETIFRIINSRSRNITLEEHISEDEITAFEILVRKRNDIVHESKIEDDGFEKLKAYFVSVKNIINKIVNIMLAETDTLGNNSESSGKIA